MNLEQAEKEATEIVGLLLKANRDDTEELKELSIKLMTIMILRIYAQGFRDAAAERLLNHMLLTHTENLDRAIN
jgi:hypothetical protein